MRSPFILFIMLLLQVSCNYDIELEFPKSENTGVANCFFSSDSDWNIHLAYSTNISGVYSPANIEGAKVTIQENGAGLTDLTYAGSGKYTCLERPQTGQKYTVIINTPDGAMLTATDTLPVYPVISSIVIHPGTEQLSDIQSTAYVDSVYRFDLKLEDGDIQNLNYYLIRLYKWKIKFTRILLPADSLQSMEDDGYPTDLIEELKNIVGTEFNDLQPLMFEIGKYYLEKYKKDFIQYCEVSIDTNVRMNELIPVNIFANDPGFKGVSDNSFIIMGSDMYFKEAEYSLSLFSPVFGYLTGGSGQSQGFEWINYYDIAETWLELSTISYAGYQYYDTYIKQVLSKKNPFSEPVNTYSNIENGLGIFAGKQTLLKKIHSNY
ncbi:MAG: DUF4249 family protein [Bacteroidota bacterium]